MWSTDTVLLDIFDSWVLESVDVEHVFRRAVHHREIACFS
jgi:hypothetical protein